MSLIQSKQIYKLMGRGVWNTVTVSSGTSIASTIVTTPMSGKTAGATNTTKGVFTTSPNNKVYLKNENTGEAIVYVSGQEMFQIYSRLTESGGVWTLTYYYLNASGVETAVNLDDCIDTLDTTSADINFRYVEVVDFKDILPSDAVDAGESIDEINLSVSDPNIHLHIIQVETATASQTVFTLDEVPFDDNDVEMKINGVSYLITTDYTISGTTATWLDTDFTLDAGDKVEFIYQYAV